MTNDDKSSGGLLAEDQSMKTFAKEVPAGDCGCEHRKWAVVNRQSPRDRKKQVLQLGDDTARPFKQRCHS